MNKFVKKYFNMLSKKSINLINNFFIISILTCLFALLILSFYNTYFISINLYKSSLILFRTGLMIGLFPIFFAVIIENWKEKNNIGH